MDKIEANDIMNNEINNLRRKPYQDLVKLIDDVITKELTGKSGQLYQIEIQALWDDKKNGNLRIMVSIDDGGWRAFMPLTSDFIISPKGKFVGE